MPGAALRRRVGRAGRPLGVARFEGGLSQFLAIADNAPLSMGAAARCTIVLWAYPQLGATIQDLAAKGAGTTATREYLVRQDAANKVSFLASDATTAVSVASAAALVLNAWNFVACQYDGVNVQAAVNNAGFTTAAFSTDIQDSTNAVRLGTRSDGVEPYTGMLGRVGLAKSVLSAAELTELYNGGAGKAFAQVSPALAAKFAAYWDLDDAGGSGATWLDKASTNHLTAGTGTAAPTAVTVWR